MTVRAKMLANAQFATTAGVTLYTVPAGVSATIIDKLTATNIDSGGAQTVTINIIPASQGIGTANQITSAKSIAASTAADLTENQNQILAPGDSIVATAGVNGKIVVRLSGREIT